MVYFVDINIKTLEEKRGVPLPGISPVNGLKPKLDKVNKIQKEDKLDLLERRPAPLPNIQASDDVSCKMDGSQGLNCPVVIVMGMYYKPPVVAPDNFSWGHWGGSCQPLLMGAGCDALVHELNKI